MIAARHRRAAILHLCNYKYMYHIQRTAHATLSRDQYTAVPTSSGTVVLIVIGIAVHSNSYLDLLARVHVGTKVPTAFKLHYTTDITQVHKLS